ncbi:MAG: anti-sigma factor family protein [Planctomyces sp.]
MSPAESESKTDDADHVEPDPRLTRLVAYLDGELPAEESELMEQELAAEPALRKAADSLDRTWQMLAALEEAAASGEFTRKTIASIRTVSTPDTPQSQLGQSRSRIRSLLANTLLTLLWTAAGFAGGAAGLALAGNAPTPSSQDEQLLQTLDLLLDYQNMRQIPDARFLQQLAQDEKTGTETQP